MKKTFFLFLSLLFLWGASTSFYSFTQSIGREEVPPTIEEIHLDWLVGHTPTKPKSIGIQPICAWFDVTNRALILESDSDLGLLTICVKDEVETVYISLITDAKEERITIDLTSVQNGFYILTIQGGASDPFLLAGKIEIH